MTSKWHGWFGLGGGIKGSPAAVIPGPGIIDIYVRGTDDRLWQKWWDGERWNPSDDGWEVHDDGFKLGSSPAVLARGADFREVFARGEDGAVHHKFWDGSKWNGWFSLGGQIKGAPAVVEPTPGTMDIYVRGMDDALWQKWWDGNSWNPSEEGWSRHEDGQLLGSSPSVVCTGPGVRDVYARAPNGSVIHKNWANERWSPWFGLGGRITGAPLALAPGPGLRDLYVRGTDGRLWQKSWDGDDWIPSNLGWMMHHDGNFRIADAPGGYTAGRHFRDIHAQARDGGVVHKSWENFRRSTPLEIRDDAAKSAAIDKAVNPNTHPGHPGCAIVVVKSGRIVHLAGRGVTRLGGPPITSETMFHMASAGKQFTGLGIAMLDREQAGFSVTDPLSKHLPELAGYGSQVTIERLLHHVADIFDMYGDEGTKAIAKRSGAPTNAHVLKAIVDLGCKMDPDSAQPGTKFKYSNTGYDLLGSVIERVSGQSYPEFFRTRVFRPLGMTDSFSRPDTSRFNDANIAVGHDRVDFKWVGLPPHWMDNIVGAGSFYCSVFDLAAYDAGLAENLLVPDSVKSRLVANFATTAGGTADYGYGWFLGSDLGSYAEHGGAWNGFTAKIRRYLDNQLSVYILANRMDLDIGAIMKAAVDAYR
jgi:CubicO group peptidase (beta-lactamase class C family)